MKRSEVILKLYTLVDDPDNYMIDLPERVFSLIEQVGMTPPARINPLYKNMNIWQYTDMKTTQNMYCRFPNYEEYYLYTWEPEDG